MAIATFRSLKVTKQVAETGLAGRAYGSGKPLEPGCEPKGEEKMFGVRNPLLAAFLNWIVSRLEDRQPKAALTR